MLNVVAFSKVLLLWALRPFPIVLVHPDHVGEALMQKVIQRGWQTSDFTPEAAIFGWDAKMLLVQCTMPPS